MKKPPNPSVRKSDRRLSYTATRRSFRDSSNSKPPTDEQLAEMAKIKKRVHSPKTVPVEPIPDREDVIFPDKQDDKEDDGSPAGPQTSQKTSPLCIRTEIGVRGVAGNAYPPDTIGVSDTTPSFLVMTNQQVWGYPRTFSGPNRPYYWMTLADFFTRGLPANHRPTTLDAFDPYIVRDPLSNQYVAVALNRQETGEPGLFLGSTQDGKVMENWQYVWISCASLGIPAGQWFDYPRVGTSQDFLTVSVNVYDASRRYVEQVTLLIDKAPYYSTGAVNLELFKTSYHTLVPVRTFDSTAPHYLVRTGAPNNGADYCYIHLFWVTGSFANNTVTINGPLVLATRLPYNTNDPGNIGPQPGGPNNIELGKTSMQSAVMRGGEVWCAHTIAMPETGTVVNSGVQGYRILASTSNSRILTGVRYHDSGFQGGARESFAFPSIAVNKLGDVLIGMASFRASYKPQGLYTSRAFGDQSGQLRLQSSAVESNTNWTQGRWGDYSATIVDPVDDLSFWTLQMTANAPTQWWTTWMQIPQITGH